MSNTTPELPTFSMEVEPRLHYEMLKRWMEEEAASKCTHIYPEGGLNELNVTDTPAQYAARNMVVIDEHGAEQPRPRPAMPARPADPAPNAPNATVAMYTANRENHRDITLALTALRKSVLAIAGPTIRNELSHDQGGLAAKSFAQIILHIATKYGTLNSQDLKEKRAKLSNKFTTAAQFASEAAQFQRNITILQENGDATSQVQQLDLLTEATNGVLGIPPIIARYNRRVPIVANRVIADLIAAIELELPLATTADVGYANAANFTKTGKESNTQDNYTKLSLTPSSIEKLLTRMEAVETAVSRGPGKGAGRASRNSRNNPAGRGAARINTAANSTAGRTQAYCFEHGTCFHSGLECRTMEKDATYTTAMKEATKPCIIGGFQGNEK